MDGEIRHLRDLLFLRDLFAANGATEDELGRYEETIAAARVALAETARAEAAPLAA